MNKTVNLNVLKKKERKQKGKKMVQWGIEPQT